MYVMQASGNESVTCIHYFIWPVALHNFIDHFSHIHLYACIMLVRFLRLETLARKYRHLSFLFTAFGVLWEKSQTSATFQ